MYFIILSDGGPPKRRWALGNLLLLPPLVTGLGVRGFTSKARKIKARERKRMKKLGKKEKKENERTEGGKRKEIISYHLHRRYRGLGPLGVA